MGIKNTDISHLRKLADKYDVDIEIKFGKNFRAIVSDEKEGHYIKNGFDANLVEDIEKVCREIKDRRNSEMREVSKRLKEIDSSTLPDTLFK
jgi:hypothetical protein